MFRTMRRKGQQLPEDECRRILRECRTGVLAVLGDDGYPYTIPLNYFYEGESIYFHCAREGHKIDAVQKDAHASFCVIEKDEVKPERLATDFRSVVSFGRIAIVADDKEKMDALEKFTFKYAPQSTPEARQAEIEKFWNRLCILKFGIEHMSGKEGLTLAAQRKKASL